MHKREASTQPEVPAPTITKSTEEDRANGMERSKKIVGRSGFIVSCDGMG